MFTTKLIYTVQCNQTLQKLMSKQIHVFCLWSCFSRKAYFVPLGISWGSSKTSWNHLKNHMLVHMESGITQTAWWHEIVRILWASLHLFFLFFFHIHLHALPPSSPPPTTSTYIHLHLHLYLSLALVLSSLSVISLAGWFREARLLIAGSHIPCPKRGYIIFFFGFNLKSRNNLCTEAALKPCLFSRRMKI